MKTRILTTILALFAIATAAQAQFGGGRGTQGNPYIISTTDHWTELANNVNGGNHYSGTYFRLDADLDFTGKTYTVIGTSQTNGFCGNFNGNGHTISGVQLERTADAYVSLEVGLFGEIGGAVIENLTLSNSTIKARMDVGGIVGRAYGGTISGTIRNCHVTSDVTIEVVHVFDYGVNQPVGNLGGIVGKITGIPIQIVGCTSAAALIAPSGSDKIGGIAGVIEEGGSIENCAYTGTINFGGTEYVGGIVGRIWDSSTTTLTNNFVGGNCTLGAVGVAGSTQGTDEGYDITHIYSASINKALVNEGSIDTPPVKTIDGENYYTAGTLVTLSGLYTSGKPAGEGMVWGYRANKGFSIDSDHAPLLPQGDGTWQFTMPAANVTINPFGARSFDYDTYIQFASREVPYTGEAQWPTITRVLSHGYTLAEGVGYITDIPASGFTAVGKHPFRIWGVGLYSGLRTDTFTITRAPLTNLTLSETTFYHDGAVHKPTLTVKAGSKTLVKGTDYETDLPAGGFTELGGYTIKVWGVGNYTDTLSATYTICHPWQGMGTEREPFLIQNTDDMDRLAALVNGGRNYAGVYFEQTADLDYAGKTYTPVGNYNYGFKGTFNGNGHTISHVIIQSTLNFIGLFGWLESGGSINGLTLGEGSSIAGWNRVGGIVGQCGGAINGCNIVEGVTISANKTFVGGIVGDCVGGNVSNCQNRADVSSNTIACGGIVGIVSSGGEVLQCSNYGSVQASENCGGIVGRLVDCSMVTECINEGSISGNEKVGGIVGFIDNQNGNCFCIVSNCLNLGGVSASNSNYLGSISGDMSVGAIFNNNYYLGECTVGGINGSDVAGQAMRGWPIIVDENSIGFNPIPDASGNMVGTYYDDGTNNHYYVGEGELLRFMLFGGTGYTANGTALAVVGHDDDYDVDYYELTMPAALVHIAPLGLTLTLYDNWVNNHNREDIAEADGKVRSVIIDGRTLYKTGIWNTLCLPFNLDDFEGTPLKDATVKTLTSSSFANGTLTLNFTTVSAIEAGKPYLVKWASGDNIENPVFSGVTICNTLAPTVTDCVDFIGSYDIEYLTGQDRSVLYLGGDNKLYYPINDMKVNAFRGHFQLKNGLTAGDLPSNAKNFVLNFGDSTTEIVNYQLSTVNSNDSWYSIDGRCLQGKPTQKGVYIRNGKKIIK